jgi:hypothetical protein
LSCPPGVFPAALIVIGTTGAKTSPEQRERDDAG